MAQRIFCGFLSLGHRILSRILSPDFFSSFLWGKSAQINPPRKSLAKSSKIYTTKVPDKFLQRGRAEEWAFDAASRGYPEIENEAPRDELKNGRGRGSACSPY